VPGLWALLEGVGNPKVAAALLAAGAHVAPVTPARPAPRPAAALSPRVPTPEEAAGGGEAAAGPCECAVAVEGNAEWLAQQLLRAAGVLEQ
jgi:hypothetical protein